LSAEGKRLELVALVTAYGTRQQLAELLGDKELAANLSAGKVAAEDEIKALDDAVLGLGQAADGAMDPNPQDREQLGPASETEQSLPAAPAPAVSEFRSEPKRNGIAVESNDPPQAAGGTTPKSRATASPTTNASRKRLQALKHGFCTSVLSLESTSQRESEWSSRARGCACRGRAVLHQLRPTDDHYRVVEDEFKRLAQMVDGDSAFPESFTFVRAPTESEQDSDGKRSGFRLKAIRLPTESDQDSQGPVW